MFWIVDGGMVLYVYFSLLMFNCKVDWVIFYEVMEIGEKIFIWDIMKIEKGWLVEYVLDFY